MRENELKNPLITGTVIMTYEQYELRVRDYLKAELKKTFNCEIAVEHQEYLYTPTKRKYNIDLHYFFNISDIKYLTIIECKQWKTTITRDMVLVLKAKAQELGAHKAILITSKGFQHGAIECARENGIGLIKMTSTGKLEVFSNYIGTDFPSLFNELMKETKISEEETNIVDIGVIFPLESVEDYIKKKFGEELIYVLRVFNDNMDGIDISKLKNKTLKMIKTIPFNWYREYEVIETCGLPLKIFNENEVRRYNILIHLLKSSITNK